MGGLKTWISIHRAASWHAREFETSQDTENQQDAFHIRGFPFDSSFARYHDIDSPERAIKVTQQISDPASRG